MFFSLYKSALISFIVLCSVYLSIKASDETLAKQGIGLQGGAGYIIHSVEFSNLANIPNCCPKFDGGNGIGARIALFFEYPVFNDLLFRAEIGGSKFDGSFKNDEIIKIDNETTDAKIRHTLDIDMLMINYGFGFNYKPFDFISIRGLIISGHFLENHFSQKEILVEPKYGTFENGARTRNNFDGDLSNTAKPIIFARLGLGWDIEILHSRFHRTIVFTPSIEYDYSLNSLVKNMNWNVNCIYFSLSFKYIFKERVSTPLVPIE